MEKTATEWLIDEAMKLVVQYMQGTLNEDTLDDVIYKIGTKAKEMHKQQIIEAAMWMPEPFSSIEFIPELAKQYYNDKYGDM